MAAFIELPASAFPNECDDGMFLRDYFAAFALQGFIASYEDADNLNKPNAAKNAYQFADAMMEARKNGNV